MDQTYQVYHRPTASAGQATDPKTTVINEIRDLLMWHHWDVVTVLVQSKLDSFRLGLTATEHIEIYRELIGKLTNVPDANVDIARCNRFRLKQEMAEMYLNMKKPYMAATTWALLGDWTSLDLNCDRILWQVSHRQQVKRIVQRLCRSVSSSDHYSFDVYQRFYHKAFIRPTQRNQRPRRVAVFG